jgi:hypothetical protein
MIRSFRDRARRRREHAALLRVLRQAEPRMRDELTIFVQRQR